MNDDCRPCPVLAVTGGIGAGKSYVCNIFSSLYGIPVYDSDSHAKSLYDTDSILLSRVRKIAGDDIVSSDGKLLRGVLAGRIFNDREMLAAVEAEVFPAVMRDFARWKLRAVPPSGGGVCPPFVIIESAIFLAKPVLYPMADRVLYVDAPVELRIERVMRRDNASRDAVLSRIASQPPVDLALASWIIDTSSDRLSMEKKIAGIVSELSGNQLSCNQLQ